MPASAKQDDGQNTDGQDTDSQDADSQHRDGRRDLDAREGRNKKKKKKWFG